MQKGERGDTKNTRNPAEGNTSGAEVGEDRRGRKKDYHDHRKAFVTAAPGSRKSESLIERGLKEDSPGTWPPPPGGGKMSPHEVMYRNPGIFRSRIWLENKKKKKELMLGTSAGSL